MLVLADVLCVHPDASKNVHKVDRERHLERLEVSEIWGLVQELMPMLGSVPCIRVEIIPRPVIAVTMHKVDKA